VDTGLAVAAGAGGCDEGAGDEEAAAGVGCCCEGVDAVTGLLLLASAMRTSRFCRMMSMAGSASKRHGSSPVMMRAISSDHGLVQAVLTTAGRFYLGSVELLVLVSVAE
jgi:hypothetical protein